MDTSRPCTCGHSYQAHNRRYRYCVACTYDATIPVLRECNAYEAETSPEDEAPPTVRKACAALLDAKETTR